MPAAALEGVTVLDFSTVGPATRCTRILADYGASVVKVGVPEIGPRTALSLPGGPNLLSIGELVEDEGWHFYWPDPGNCYLDSPDEAKRTHFAVAQRTPLLGVNQA